MCRVPAQPPKGDREEAEAHGSAASTEHMRMFYHIWFKFLNDGGKRCSCNRDRVVLDSISHTPCLVQRRVLSPSSGPDHAAARAPAPARVCFQPRRAHCSGLSRAPRSPANTAVRPMVSACGPHIALPCPGCSGLSQLAPWPSPGHDSRPQCPPAPRLASRPKTRPRKPRLEHGARLFLRTLPLAVPFLSLDPRVAFGRPI